MDNDKGSYRANQDNLPISINPERSDKFPLKETDSDVKHEEDATREKGESTDE